uniref:hypothetical protein n=1 Tax=Mycoplasma leonicaptivi TaxID=36742 RepID=UPI000566593B
NTACLEFKKIKKQYNDHINEQGLIGINPAMLIQIDNDSKNIEKNAEFNKQMDLIIKILESHNLSWVKYFDEKKVSSNIRQKENLSLRDISHKSSPVDVIIFKIGPATGWNIPRACMLVQLRNISSTNLSIQTIGRIKRNPNPEYTFRDNSISRNYYIYSNLDVKDTQIKSAVLKPQYSNLVFPVGVLEGIKNKQTIISIDEYEVAALEKLEKDFDGWNNTLQEINFLKFYYVNAEKYKNELLKNKYISIETKKWGSGLFIDTKIHNSLELQIYLIKLQNKHQKFFTKKIIQYFDEMFLKLHKENLQKNLYWLTIYKTYADELHKIYQDIFKKEFETKNAKYAIKMTNKLPQNLFWITDEKSQKLYETKNYFAYKELTSENIKDLKFDSEAELFFAKEVEDFLQRNDIVVWTKNPVQYGINFEYINNSFELSNSYPDFIIKKDNHFVFVEVKTYLNDLDENKTKTLFEEYQKYLANFNDKQYDLSLIICFVKPKNNDADFKYAGSSSINEVDIKLKNFDQNNSHIHDQIISKSLQHLKEIFSITDK